MGELGTGLAQGGKDTIRYRKKYQEYKIEAITSGGEVLSFEDWLKRQGIQPPPNLPK